MRRMLILGLALGLAACANVRLVPQNERPAAVYSADDAECRDWAVMMPQGLDATEPRSVGWWWRRCMRGRGWYTEVWELP